MSLRLPDKWVWDFWFAQDESVTHIFYLQAPRNLKVEHLRHWNVSIGHAVSQDLIHWEILPDVLSPSKKNGTWDDYTTWTGSIFKHDFSWYMFYTGSNRAEKGSIQRIGLATSDDLLNWERYQENPIIQADPQWYETLDQGTWHDECWRDPWIFQYDGKFHAYITARSNTREISSRGVIGHATSNNLLNWEIQPPITEPGEFSYLEVPQLVHIGNRWYLLFSVTHDKYSISRQARTGIKLETGTHYFMADNPFGPFKCLTDNFMVGDEVGSLYSGKVIRKHQGEWVYMAFKMFAPGNEFIGELTDPLPIKIKSNGQLLIQW